MIRLDVRNANLKRNVAHKELFSEIMGIFFQIMNLEHSVCSVKYIMWKINILHGGELYCNNTFKENQATVRELLFWTFLGDFSENLGPIYLF